MASPGNQNQPGGVPFDMHKFFKPSPVSASPPSSSAAAASSVNPSAPPLSANPNFVISSPFPPPSASYPPPTGGATTGYSYPPPQATSSPFLHPQLAPNFHLHMVNQFSAAGAPPPSHHHNHHPPPTATSGEFANMPPHRSMSFPTPPLQPPPGSNHQQFQNPQSPQNPSNPNAGARLMALLSAPPGSGLEGLHQPPMGQIQQTSSGGSDFGLSQNMPVLPTGLSNLVGVVHPGPMRMPSSKLPKGRHLIGDRVEYDIDVRMPGEFQPQLEVTPITKYGSDPGLVLGRQIAVNKTYICYGLKLGAVRVLNINTALRSLLKGLAQRVTDMAFFAEDVHLLASSSVDGRVYVWKITEGPDEEDKPHITGKIVVAVQIVGEWQSVHPRVCWHCHKQEVLVVAIGKHVLKIDTTKVGKGEKYSAEEPLTCSIDKLIDGIQLVGDHDGEVTDLSMSQWMTTRLVSASVDGTIKIWADRKAKPIAVLRPHDGQPVNSVTFLAAPDRPDHIILITGGPLNREMKVWVSASEEGWLLPSDAESWECTQTMELKSSGAARVEDAFFNQVVALPQSSLLLLANARKNAIYALHLEYGPFPAATRVDYIAEFTVTMPILSFTGTSDLLPHGEHIVQVYCVQTQAIQQYALDLAQCLPPPVEHSVPEKSDSIVSHDAANLEGLPTPETPQSKPPEVPVAGSEPKSSVHAAAADGASSLKDPVNSVSMESSASQQLASSSAESRPLPASSVSTSLPLSPRLSGKLSGFRSPSGSFEPIPPVNDHVADRKVTEHSTERQLDAIHGNSSDVAALDDHSRNEENKVSADDLSSPLSHPIKFKHPTHLVTPSEILMANSSSEVNNINDRKNEGDANVQEVVVSSDTRNVDVEVKVVGETKFSQNPDGGSQEQLRNMVSGNNERTFYSQASDLGMDMARECRDISPETYVVEEATQYDGGSASELARTSCSQEQAYDLVKDVRERVADSAIPVPSQPQSSQTPKGKKQKGKHTQGSGSLSPLPGDFNPVDSSNEPGVSSNIPTMEGASSQILALQETLNQLMAMQKDMQKQMTAAAAGPVAKEGKRLEAAIGRAVEKAAKANADALWARFQEETTKQEKLARERAQQLTSLITGCINKDFPAVLEKSIKKEFAALGQAVARSISPTIEKTVSATIAEAFQKGVGDKAVNQLEKSVNSKLEATVARQIQAQFQTSGKQALQETLKYTMEASVVPAFELSCRAMFEQVDSTLQKGMAEHATATRQQLESTHSSLALTLRETINSATSMTQTLTAELAEGQRKLLALAAVGANPIAGRPLVRELSNGPLAGLHDQIEAPVDPTKELSRLVAERKYEEAFTAALQRSDVSIVSWLCSQVDLQSILSSNTLPLSQGVLLSLVQQLACDISKETSRKLSWMMDVLSAINPTDPMIAVHVRPIFEQVYQILNNHRGLPTTTGAEVSSIRLLMHIINSMLMACK